MFRSCLLAAALFTLPTAAIAQVPLDGWFIAFQACEANKKKTSDNPGQITLEENRAYEMIGKNAEPGTHYLLRVPGAPVTESRWVEMGCGAYAPQSALILSGGSGGGGGGGGTTPAPGALADDSIELVLAASWQPGFCATPRGQSKVECQTQTMARPDATQFSIHGLWPDDLDDKSIFPCNCDSGGPTSCRVNRSGPSASVSAPVMMELEVLMPGVQSGLHDHEWAKHGTCYEDDVTGPDRGADADEYFSETMALVNQLNASSVRQLFVDNLDQVLTRSQIRAEFDTAFGPGAGDRVLVICERVGGEDVIKELWISLGPGVDASPDLGVLILAAPTTDISSNSQRCSGGKVVRAPN